MRLRDRFLDLLFPPRCPVCGEVAPVGRVFCPACRKALEESKSPHALPAGEIYFQRAYYAADYTEQTRPAVLRLKEIPDSHEAVVFAEMLETAMESEYPAPHFDAVVPIPLTEGKRRRRGHNQAETLARHLAEHYGVPCRTDLLLQREGTAPQHTLGREKRQQNAKKIYEAAPNASAAGCILLVDDVLTTGATLNRCAYLLRSLGAEQVLAATALSVPLHSFDKPFPDASEQKGEESHAIE